MGGLFFTYNSILVVSSSIFLFLYFVDMKSLGFKMSSLIQLLSPLTFGVYLFHDNYLIRGYLWNSLISPEKVSNSSSLIPTMILCVLLIFTISATFEYSRKLIVRKFILRGELMISITKVHNYLENMF